jgi:hypothetical protein
MQAVTCRQAVDTPVFPGRHPVRPDDVLAELPERAPAQ